VTVEPIAALRDTLLRRIYTHEAHIGIMGFHRPLHSVGRIGHGHLPGDHSFHATRLARSCHGSLPSGHITYP
jgi:hypothetical protein